MYSLFLYNLLYMFRVLFATILKSTNCSVQPCVFVMYVNTVWAELTVVKILNLLVHPVTSRL
jgi:hypothetical protein